MFRKFGSAISLFAKKCASHHFRLLLCFFCVPFYATNTQYTATKTNNLQPASRETVDKLFDASDEDNSGTIDEEEFQKIMVVCCGQIASRVLLYLALLLLISPFCANGIVLALTYLLADKEWFIALFHMVQDPVAKVPWLDALFDWDTLAEGVFCVSRCLYLLSLLLMVCFFSNSTCNELY